MVKARVTPPPLTSSGNSAETKAKTKRGSRGGRRHKKPAAEVAQEPVAQIAAPQPETKPKTKRSSRSGRRRKKPAAAD